MVVLVMDVPASAVILSLIGAVALGRVVVSILVFLAETFLFRGESVRPSLAQICSRIHYLELK